jgi:hypothetical protein
MPGLLGKQFVIEKFWLPGVMLQEEEAAARKKQAWPSSVK